MVPVPMGDHNARHAKSTAGDGLEIFFRFENAHSAVAFFCKGQVWAVLHDCLKREGIQCFRIISGIDQHLLTSMANRDQVDAVIHV